MSLTINRYVKYVWELVPCEICCTERYSLNNEALCSHALHTCIDVNMADTSYVGLHLFCKMSRHMLPSAYTALRRGGDPKCTYMPYPYICTPPTHIYTRTLHPPPTPLLPPLHSTPLTPYTSTPPTPHPPHLHHNKIQRLGLYLHIAPPSTTICTLLPTCIHTLPPQARSSQ